MNQENNWVARVIRKRFGIAMIWMLLLWPLLGFFSMFESILVNGLLLDTYAQLRFVAFGNTMAFFFAGSIQRLLNSRIQGGCFTWIIGDGQKRWGVYRCFGVWLVSLATPLVLAFGFGSELPYSGAQNTLRALIAILAGAAAGIFTLWGAGVLKSLLVGSDENTRNFFPFEARTRQQPRRFATVTNWLAKIRQHWLFGWFFKAFPIKRIDLQFLAYLVVLASIHFGTAKAMQDSDTWLTSAPAMVILLIWITCMGLAGAANLFDRYRIPVSIVALFVLTLCFGLSGSTRNLKTVPVASDGGSIATIANLAEKERKAINDEKMIPGSSEHEQLVTEKTSGLEEAAWNAIVQRMKDVDGHPENGKTVVVITCPGGGIHAAAWSACVMDRLSTEYQEFDRSLAVVSGVSGGSVGALMFVSSRYESELRPIQTVSAKMPTNEEIHNNLREFSPALDLSAQSSLEHIAYGITADDLYSVVTPLLPRSIPQSDRGQRLEDSLHMRLPERNRELTMSQWGDRALAGAVPIVIFNSTDAVTGRRVLFDTVPTPRRASSVGKTSRPLNYRELMGKDAEGNYVDVRPSTAARTSATFPYISPFTKPDLASDVGQAVALCDGGYVDNEGIVTAVNWIEFMLTRSAALPANERPFQRILLIRIEPAPTQDDAGPRDAGGLAGWFRWLAGPAETMINVRSASQLERGNLEADLAALNGGMNTETASGDQRIEVAAQRTQKLLGSRSWDWIKRRRVTGDSKQKPTDETDKSTTLGSKLPVVEVTIAFDNTNRKVPLNWKLSKKQKQWYIDSWEKYRSEEGTFNSTLERFFTRTN